MFIKFPREVGPPRKIVNTLNEWLAYVNLYNGKKKAVYTSVYNCEDVNGKADYSNAKIDKLFFDFDDKSCDSWKECNCLHIGLLKENIKHVIVMSGRGYHLYIFTKIYQHKNPKSVIYNAQMDFIKKLNLTVDRQVIGNPAQLARVPNTYNMKGQRFCIPLTKEQFKQGDIFCKALANKQNFVGKISMGERLLDLTPYDCDKPNYEIDIFAPMEDITEDLEHLDYFANCPNCIKNILAKNNPGWKERYLIIVYFRDLGYSKQEIFSILKQHLNDQKLRHCIESEKQLQYLFDRHDLMFPVCSRIKQDGFCTGDCEMKGCVIYR